MSWILGLVGVAVLLLLAWGWFHFIRGHTLPPASEVREITIFYSENAEELLPDHYEPKEFMLKTAEEIRPIIEKLEGIPISRIPLVDGDDADEGPNWILNLHFRNRQFRFLTVDRKQVSGNAIDSSEIFRYLREHFT